ncbi:MAG: hypothetical protein AAGG68_22815 [Bacteroidota bacterium]
MLINTFITIPAISIFGASTFASGGDDWQQEVCPVRHLQVA